MGVAGVTRRGVHLRPAERQRVRYGPGPSGSGLVIYRPHPPEHASWSNYYQATEQTLQDFIGEALRADDSVQQLTEDKGGVAAYVDRMYHDVVQGSTDDFDMLPPINVNGDLFCFLNGQLLASSMRFYTDGLPAELINYTAFRFYDEEYHPDSDTARQLRESLHNRSARAVAAATKSAAAPSQALLATYLAAFFADPGQPLKITG